MAIRSEVATEPFNQQSKIKIRNLMKFQTTMVAAAAMLMGAGHANAALTLVQGTQPAGTTSAFNAIGTFNLGNQKARLEAAGQTTVQGGNPGNGWWGDGTPATAGTGPVRSWEVGWNNATKTVTFNVFASSDWTGNAAMSMTRTPVLTAGNTLVGLDIGARLTSTAQSVKLDNVQFNNGSGFVDVNTAEATYSGNANFNNYHSLSGTLGNFTLRGTALFPTGSVTSDGMRFFVNARQGVAPVPEPSTYVAGALLALPVLLNGMRVMRRRQQS